MVSASQAPHGNRALQLCPEGGRWSGSHLEISVKVHDWPEMTSTALACWNVILVSTVSFLICAFVSSFDQRFLTRWQTPQISQTFHSWLFLSNLWWLCSREQKCKGADLWCPVQLGFGAATRGALHWCSLEQPVPGEGSQQSHGIPCEAGMGVWWDTALLSRGHRADFWFLLLYDDYRTFCSSHWKTALAQTRQNLLLCITLQGTVMQISCEGAVTSDKLDLCWMFQLDRLLQ